MDSAPVQRQVDLCRYGVLSLFREPRTKGSSSFMDPGMGGEVQRGRSKTGEVLGTESEGGKVFSRFPLHRRKEVSAKEPEDPAQGTQEQRHWDGGCRCVTCHRPQGPLTVNRYGVERAAFSPQGVYWVNLV